MAFQGAYRVAGLAAAVAAVAAVASSAAAAGLKAEIVRTRYGVPHVTASDYAGLGYGQAYAYAQDNLCLLADRVVTVRGERSKYFGPDATTSIAFNDVRNLDSDVFFRGVADLPELRRGFASTSADYQALVRGYAAGFNRYLRDLPPGKRPAACRDAAWVRPISTDDVIRMTEDRTQLATGEALLRWIVSTTPPAPGAAPKPLAQLELGLLGDGETLGVGSNGWAFGREVTANGSGVLLGNPHFPWETTLRFYEIHLTIPGKLDTMGVTIAGAPGMSIGFNRDVAWTHTVSTDRHFTFFELQLDPADPTVYRVDGKPLKMTHRTVSVEIAGRTQPETRTLYSTIYGPVVATPASPWTPSRAYAMRDANRANKRSGDAWLDIARARSVGDIRGILTRTLAMPWVNTIAADRRGDVLYADITATPNVSAEKLKACAPPTAVPSMFAASRFFALDGARSACNWDAAPGTPLPGLMPGAAMPSLIRSDYVANSNDSYWLANPKAPLPAQSPIVGATAYAQGLRTRAGLIAIAGRLDGSDGLGGNQIDPAKVKAMLYANRNLAAELVLDDLLKACAAAPTATTAAGAAVDLGPACAVLAKWDRRMDAGSVGAMLFVEFWRKAGALPGVWAVPFDVADPIHTPRGLNTAGGKALQALAEAVELMKAQKLPLDAPYGTLHFAVRGDQHIPVHGGEGADGVLNAQQSRFVPAAGGYVPYHGSSYIQVVTFDAKGPVAEAVLTYSQSTDPASPHYGDQTRLHAGKGWSRLPFHKADVAAQAQGPALRIAE